MGCSVQTYSDYITFGEIADELAKAKPGEFLSLRLRYLDRLFQALWLDEFLFGTRVVAKIDITVSDDYTQFDRLLMLRIFTRDRRWQPKGVWDRPSAEDIQKDPEKYKTLWDALAAISSRKYPEAQRLQFEAVRISRHHLQRWAEEQGEYAFENLSGDQYRAASSDRGGRPTAEDAHVREFERRKKAGLTKGSMTAESRAIRESLVKKFPGDKIDGSDAIRRHIKSQYQDWQTSHSD